MFALMSVSSHAKICDKKHKKRRLRDSAANKTNNPGAGTACTVPEIHGIEIAGYTVSTTF